MPHTADRTTPATAPMSDDFGNVKPLRGLRLFKVEERQAALRDAQRALFDFDRAVIEGRAGYPPKDREGYLLLIRCAQLRCDIAAGFA